MSVSVVYKENKGSSAVWNHFLKSEDGFTAKFVENVYFDKQSRPVSGIVKKKEKSMGSSTSQVPINVDLWRILLLNAVGWFLLFIFVPIFIVYRTIIDLVLKLKLGKKYGGLFNAEDAFFLSPDHQSKYCIATVFYIRSDKELDVFHLMKDVIQKKIFDHPEQYPKLTGSKREFGGYPYWIKNDCQVDDVVQPIKVPENEDFNEEYLKKCTGEITNSNHGKHGTVLWDVHVGEKPLKGDYADNCYRYPVILRFQHSITDGTSLVALYIRLFGDETSKNYAEQLSSKQMNGAPEQKTQKTSMELLNQYLTKYLKAFRLYLKIFFITLGRLTLANQLRPQDVNALHASKYSGEKVVAWGNVDVSLIKNIKNRTNTKFTSVVNAAVSASMTNYFKRNGKPVPDFTSGMITRLVGFPTMDESKPVRLENKTTAGFVNLPCIHESKTSVEALENIAKSVDQQLKHSDIVGARLVGGFLAGFFPLKIICQFGGMESHTVLITNVPGMSQMKVLDGCTLERMIPLAPNGRGIGITFTFLSYDSQLQVGVLVDKALTDCQEEVQRMANDLICYIKMLDIESRKKFIEMFNEMKY